MSLQLNNITQIGIVTGDLYQMIRRYEEHYGVGPWEIFDGNIGFKDEAENLTVYGKRQDFKVSLALCTVGNVQIEIIQPLDEYSDYARHLKKHGEGVIHHISVITDNDAFREKMKERKIGSVMRGDVIGVETFEYFDTGEDLGVKIEIHDLVKKTPESL
jgi:hypothetical protein